MYEKSWIATNYFHLIPYFVFLALIGKRKNYLCVCQPIEMIPATYAILVTILFPSSISSLVLNDSLPVTSSIGPGLYCNRFESRCPDANIVVIKSAVYYEVSSGSNTCSYDGGNGGQPLGDFDLSNNCSIDVTSQFEKKCFGKYRCDYEKLNERVESCTLEESQSIFVVSYDCILVELDPCDSCDDSEYAKLTKPSGYLASEVVLQHRTTNQCGSHRCPWSIKVQPGQVINVTILDADRQESGGASNQDGYYRSPQHSLSYDSSTCRQKYVTIKERANPKDFNYCGSKSRLTHLYLSVSNSLEIQINSENLSDIREQFLVYYEVLGCPDIIPPRFSRMSRTGNTCEIDCPGTDLKWILTCKNSIWEGKDDLGTCPPAPGLLEAEPQTSKNTSGGIFTATLFNMPMGVLMAMVIACAVILGVLILTTGLVCMKRHQYDAKHKDDPNVYGAACSEFEFREMGVGPAMHPALLGKSAPYMNTGAGYGASRSRRASADLLMAGPRDNTYAMQEMVRMDSRPLPSLPTGAPPPMGNSWRRGEGPMPYGIVNFFPPGTGQQPNRVTVQLHRADSGVDQAGGAAYRARFPPPGSYPTKYVGPIGTGSRYDNRNNTGRRMPPNSAGIYNDSNQEENHYFVLDGNAPNDEDEALERSGDQTMMMTMSGLPPYPQPPPAHQNPRLPMATNARPTAMGNNTIMMNTQHRHQHSYGGGGDPRCTCDGPPRFPPPGGNFHPSNPDGYYAPDQIIGDAKMNKHAGDASQSSASLNNQL